MNETQTLTISEFLKARLAEDEAVASNDLTPGPWTVQYECPEGDHHHDWDEVWIAGRGRSTVGGFNERYTAGARDAEHVVHFQPARVLEDIMSKRAIVDLHTGTHECMEVQGSCVEYFAEWEACPTLRLLAAPYRHHTDWREEWA